MSKYAIFGTDAKGIETIKGNGWDVNIERIELNGINAELIYEDDYRCVSMSGPAVEDIFKCIRDLIKENEALAEKNERLAEENYMLRKYCDEQGKTYKTEMDKRDGYIKAFKTKIEKRTERNRELEEEIERLIKENQELQKYCDEQEEEFNMEINKKDGYIDILKRKLDEKTENYNRLQDAYLKEINKQYGLRKCICELEKEKDEHIYKTGIQDHEIKMAKKAYNTTKIYETMMSSSDTDITRMYPCTYSDVAKEVLGWIDGEMKNGTDYATKIFNKEEVGNMFSITFCKVPVKSEEDE